MFNRKYNDTLLEVVKSGVRCEFNGKMGHFEYHHGARCRGYVSRKAEDGVIENANYKGRFGEGVTVKTPAWDSTQYCYREYYIFKEEEVRRGYGKDEKN